jgi:hypothetical protein
MPEKTRDKYCLLILTQNKMEGQTWKVSFLDKKREKTNIKIEITYRNGYKEFTVCSDTGQGQFEPTNEPQQRLLDLWDEYHLNGMNAGTKKQQEALKDKNLSYDEACTYLSCLNSDGTEMSAIKRAEVEVKVEELTEKVSKFNLWVKTFAENFERFTRKNGGWYSLTRNDRAKMEEKIINVTNIDTDEDPTKIQGRVYIDSIYSFTPFKNKIIKAIKNQINRLNEEIDKAQLQSLLYDVHPETGKVFKYGRTWIQNSLPEDIEEQVESIIEEIEELEEERRGKPLNELSEEQIFELVKENTYFNTKRDIELAVAFVYMFNLSEDDLQDIEIDDTDCKVQGINYLAGNDEEMDEAWDQDLENYLDECVLPDLHENVRKYYDKEAWKEDARQDPRSNSLNRYDGDELEMKINDTYYYAYRQ